MIAPIRLMEAAFQAVRLDAAVPLRALVMFAMAGPSALAAPPNTAKPSFQNVRYGPHPRNVLDFWWAHAAKPTPVIVFIHGGGFIQGDKSQIRGSAIIARCLDAGISFAAIDYRFLQHAPLQDILEDAARSIQYLRSRAMDWDIDPARIAAFGTSAGGGTSLWLAFHDDLADPKAKDPVLRQSSRLAAVGSINGQASYDRRDWDSIVGPFPRYVAELDRLMSYGSDADWTDPALDRVMKGCAILPWISAGDPPVIVTCSYPDGDPTDAGHYVHHPRHALAIADRCKERGVPCRLLRGEPGSENEQQARVIDFLIEQLGPEAKTSR